MKNKSLLRRGGLRSDQDTNTEARGKGDGMTWRDGDTETRLPARNPASRSLAEGRRFGEAGGHGPWR